MRYKSPQQKTRELFNNVVNDSQSSDIFDNYAILERIAIQSLNHKDDYSRKVPGVGSILFDGRFVPPVVTITACDTTKQWVLDWLEQEQKYRESKNFLPLLPY